MLARSVSCLYSTSLTNFKAIRFAGAVAWVNTTVADCLFDATETVCGYVVSDVVFNAPPT